MGSKFGGLGRVDLGKLERLPIDPSKLALKFMSGNIIVGLQPAMLQPGQLFGYAPEVIPLLATLRREFNAVVRTLWPVGVPVLGPTPAAKQIDNPDRALLNQAGESMFPLQPRLAGLEWIDSDAPILAESRSRLLVTIADPTKITVAVGRISEFSGVIAFVESEPLISPTLPGRIAPLGVPDPDQFAMKSMEAIYNPYWACRSLNCPADWVTRIPFDSKIAVLDSGCDIQHPGFQQNVRYGTIETTNDSYGHGTFICGVIAGKKASNFGPDNNKSFWVPPGVLPTATIWTMKIFENDNFVGVQRYSTALQLIAGKGKGTVSSGVRSDTSAPDGIQVVNLSISSDTAFSENEKADLKLLEGKKITVVAAAGNAGQNGSLADVVAPARLPWCISVGAITSEINKIWERSCRASTSRPVDIYAPGADVASFLPYSNPSTLGQYSGRLDGTSMATPFVTAIVAKLRASGTIERASIITALQKRAEKFGGWYRLRW